MIKYLVLLLTILIVGSCAAQETPAPIIEHHSLQFDSYTQQPGQVTPVPQYQPQPYYCSGGRCVPVYNPSPNVLPTAHPNVTVQQIQRPLNKVERFFIPYAPVRCRPGLVIQ